MSEMTDLTGSAGPGPAEPKTKPGSRPDQAPSAAQHAPARAGARPVDRRQQRRWVPRAAGWMVLLIGLADIILGVTAPTNDLHARLQRLPVVVPGTVAVLTRTADIIIGLLLLTLSYGLRRRKHRAWQEVMALLIISAVIALAHASFLIRHEIMAVGPLMVCAVLAALIVAGALLRGE